MDKPKALFSNYTIQQKAGKTYVCVTFLTRFSIYAISIVGGVFIYYLPIPIPGWTMEILKLIVIVTIFLLTKKLLYKFFTHPILEIDSEKGTVLSSLDNSEVKQSDIKDIAIIEEKPEDENIKNAWYTLKCSLPYGEMVLPFAFTSEKKIQEIGELLKPHAKAA